ncbi:MAG TPA: zinc-dependent peptidase, partial [Anditalea sp.]|nr:zinc-dependent peptidase [Anditalea sp.]
RSQARENIHEFFAVSVEAFFENTIAFKAYHPEMYECLVFLLRQDPLVLYTGANSKNLVSGVGD